MISRGKPQLVIRAAAAATGALVLLASASAYAQADVRMIRPDVLLLLDSSGSMEWRNGVSNATCSGADGGVCNRCSNGAPICPSAVGQPNTCPAAEQRNRWTTAIEVLTGTIQGYSCVALDRQNISTYTYDFLYPVPWHQPMSNGVPLWDPAARQSADGIVDSYADRVRFGLMTFDNDYGTGIQAADGMFSYGPNRQFLANGCSAAATAINVGSKRASTDGNVGDIVPGGLVSVGPPLADATVLGSINQFIQQTIVGRPNTNPILQVRGVRPFQGTPIAAMLEDALTYWTTNPDVIPPSGSVGDPYFTCRARFNILITDGQPNMDFRPACEGGTGICPYALPDMTALRMAMSGGGLPGAKTFVIAFNATDPGATAALAPIAIAGGTTSVYYATNSSTLRAALSGVLDSVSNQTSTRTAPAFGAGSSGASNTTLYQMQSSFAVASGYPWQGVLERRRTECQGSPPVPVDQNVVQTQDDFAYLLRSAVRSAQGWGTRKLWTWYPTGATRATMTTPLSRATGDPARRDLDSSVPATLFAISGLPADRDRYLAWLRGDPTDAFRVNNPLGDIFHSNPLVVQAPSTPLADQTYSAFRQLALPVGGWRAAARTVGTREGIVYVGTNDGILHAFNIDSGEEIWGFVPPILTSAIESMYPSTHQFGVDGSPVTRDVIYTRSPSALGSAASWRTVLVVGLRDGGGAYEALDVTDPYNPSFLWQYTDSANMRSAYGSPAIATIYTSWDPTLGSAGTRMERAVAILPGGIGTAVATASCTPALGIRPALATSDSRMRVAGTPGTVRSTVRCWQGTTGQYLYVVDLQTGALIRRFGPTGSPVVGSPALWVGTPGAVSTRAYVGDADGDVWRLDMSDPDPTRWRFAVSFDGFYDAGQMAGQPIVAPPVLSVDHNGDTLVAIGSGDPDLLEGFDRNRIAVYREAALTDTAGTITSVTATNVWELRYGANNSNGDLFAGERLTGNLSLFNGNLYFGTFVPANSTDSCQLGFSRLWGIDQVQVAGGRPIARLDLDGDPNTTSDVVRVTQDINGNGSTTDDANAVLFGVGIVRRPTCVTTTTTTDPYLGTSRQFVDGMTGGDFRLVVQTGRGGSSTGGSRTNVVSRVIPPPITETSISAWAVVFE